MNKTAAVVITIGAAFLLWNVVPKVVTVILLLIMFLLINNQWGFIESLLYPKKGGA